MVSVFYNVITNYHKFSVLKTAQVSYLTVVEIRSLEIKVLAGLSSFWKL